MRFKMSTAICQFVICEWVKYMINIWTKFQYNNTKTVGGPCKTKLPAFQTQTDTCTARMIQYTSQDICFVGIMKRRKKGRRL